MASRLTVRNAVSALKRIYGMVPAEVRDLNGCHIQNFKVTVSAGNPSGKTNEDYIMKFADKSHFSYGGNAELQHAAIRHLRADNMPTPVPVETKAGGTIGDFLSDDKRYEVQLLTFIEGISVNQAKLSERDVGKISYDMGRMNGLIHRSLMNLEYDVEKASAVYSPFHTPNALDFNHKIEYVTDDGTRTLMEKYFKIFKENFLPKLPQLRKGYIHGDFSDSNTILRLNTGSWEIAGVIDFEECAYNYLVGDFGICVAYAMIKAADSQADPIKASAKAVHGYESILPLTDSEKEVLFEVALSRLTVSFASASYEAMLAPDNIEHIFAQAKSVPFVLETVDKVGRQALELKWFGKII